MRHPVEQVGETAVLLAETTDVVLSRTGEPEPYRMPMTQVWVRDAAGWTCLAGHAGPGTEVDDDLSPAGLLASIRSARTAEDAAAARQLDLAARWADLHPPESVHHAASFTTGRGMGLEVEEPIAGDGCPTVAEFFVAELGVVLGISTGSAKRLIGHALELRHRLKRLGFSAAPMRVAALG